MRKPEKPVRRVTVLTMDEKGSSRVNAIFDSGSLYTLVRAEKLPAGAMVQPVEMKFLGAAAVGSRLSVTGVIPLVIRIGAREIWDSALVSPDLSQDMLIGIDTMQRWDISILHVGGKTGVSVGLDRRDPEFNEVLCAG